MNKNECAIDNTVFSPCGKYSLTISSIPMGKYIGHTRGVIKHVSTGDVIETVNRNYSSFWYNWIYHANGSEYLLCGHDYQGQTIINLSKKTRRDLMSENSDKGFGFCWVDTTYFKDSNILIVEGCYWACPYEFRIVKFDDPDTCSLKDLEFVKDNVTTCVYNSSKKPIIKDNLIYFFKTLEDLCLKDEELEKFFGDLCIDNVEQYVVETSCWNIVDDKVLYVPEKSFIIENEIKRMKYDDELRKLFNEDLNKYKTTDDVFLMIQKLSNEKYGQYERFMSIGTTYDGWCPNWEGETTRVCYSVIRKYDDKKFFAEFEIAKNHTPMLLSLNDKKYWFTNCVDDVLNAFKLIDFEYDRLCISSNKVDI